MKPKNKEVNIFNMSLLDILCGALGAFCFMMLVLFQYWKPESPDVKKAKVDTAQLEQKLGDLMKQMKNMSNLSPKRWRNSSRCSVTSRLSNRGWPP